MEPSSPSSHASRKPLVFISHDSRDVELAKAFGELLDDASFRMLRWFVARYNIAPGQDWYEEIKAGLKEMTDLVCLLTPRSYERPWVLFEVGVGKGQGVPVYGLKLGFTVDEAPPGPFTQIQVCPNNAEDLNGLMRLLIVRHVPTWDPPPHMLETAIQRFQNRAKEIEKTLPLPKPGELAAGAGQSTASLAEELKAMLRMMPLHIESKLSEKLQNSSRVLRFFSADAVESAVRSMKVDLSDPIGLLVLCSVMREELPWIYDLGLDTYREVRTGDLEQATAALSRMIKIVELLLDGSSLAELGIASMQMSEALEMLQAHLKELERALAARVSTLS